ncbi:hypothetical protein A2415_00145 [candidate division WWE3 bacterium RIFOXYC1_FULL_39_7]|uniref:Uncharacterized protein n=1 Tax=candidate division WWE3 bacterium RIFOXYC1_FULL_39_7 TaxID=1802643 RepID=A0A1F4WKP2_UNCKA|nr:MAG: hypothetical protein A2415_00145 [candidate division WWE3 bacterium RIFOXYC1_FULL_39_7]
MIDVERIGFGKKHPTIVFEGEPTRDGLVLYFFWLHPTKGILYEACDTGGYESRWDEEERRVDVGFLRKFIFAGRIPSPRRSDRAGLELLNLVMNDIPEEYLLKRKRQVRDALNKCRDIVKIEAAARLLGI